MDNRPVRILLVDDDEDDYIITRTLLSEIEEGKFVLEWVATYNAALEAIGRNQHDGYLVDYRLGDCSGLDLLREALRNGCEAPMILLTGQGDREVDIQAMKAGATDYLVKGQIDAPMLERSIRYAIERKRAEKEIQRQLQRLTVLDEINLAVTSTLDLHGVLNILMEKIELLLPNTAILVWLLNKESGLLERVACRNLDEQQWKGRQSRDTPPLVKAVIESKAPVVTGNVQTDPRTLDPQFFRRNGLISYLGVPLIAKGEVLGVLSFYTKKEHDFSSEEVAFFSTLAGHGAMAIHNSQLYEQIKEQAVALERANKVKSEFLSFMSHELRTPLSVIMGCVTVTHNNMLGKINQKQKKILEKVMRNSNGLLTMIDSILAATRIETEAVKVESHEFNLGDFLDDLRSAYCVPLDKELTLTWDYPSDLPLMKTDSQKLKHILQNLIDNAIKFTDKGNVTLSARYFREAGTVEFKVVDMGIGIAKGDIPIIFEKFHQVDSSLARVHGGIGLGLSIVKTFTEMLGGTVDVESVPYQGSTFTVTFPAVYKDLDLSYASAGMGR
ncbi:MAG: GAF domain-containing protein [Deltaproteobacteria bacterium]|nr:GAF domain-containing protein [Deltaproteobacteria bacterium]